MFWRKKTENEIRQRQLQEASRKEIEKGGIPLIAQERLKKHAESGSKFFTSDLTTREFLLAKDRHLEPIGQVMGTSFYNVNLFASMFRMRLATGEMKAYSDAMLNARKLAVSRLMEEARLLGASGVIGVKIQAGRRPWSSSLHEFTAVGTAVRIPGWKHEPFACDLSGQEFWQLYSAGFRPVNLAFGICSYYMYVDWTTQRQMYAWLTGSARQNQEIKLFTEGVYTARNLAMDRLEKDCRFTNADGVVGVEVDYDFERVELNSDNSQAWDMIVHFKVLGTAIIEDPELVHNAIPKPTFCINLKNQKLASPKGSRFNELNSRVMENMPGELAQSEFYKQLLEENE